MSTEFNSIRAIYDELASRSSGRTPEELFEILRENHDEVESGKGSYIPGTEADYHNLSVEFARQNCYRSAAQTADYGTKIFPLNTDLLADKITYYQEIGHTDQCNEAINELYNVKKKYWTWRTFVFAIDYLKDTLSMVKTMDAFETNLKDAEVLIQEFRQTIPNDERSYMAEAELMLVQNDMDGAIQALEAGVKEVKIAPQCCMKLAELYLEKGDFAKVAEYARKGIVATAQEQPTVSAAYLYYLLALSMDAQRQEEYFGDGRHDSAKTQEILRNYKIADRLFILEGRGGVSYRRTIVQKLFILETEEEMGSEEDEDEE